MSEMLGNYYFQKRDYQSAILQYEGSLNIIHLNLAIKKKLIICYAQQKNIEKTIELFTDVVSNDINIIINTDYEDEMCPCPDLVYEFENHTTDLTEDFNHTVILGVLWLYCNIHKSFEYLQKAYQMKPENEKVSNALKIISNEILHLEKNQKSK